MNALNMIFALMKGWILWVAGGAVIGSVMRFLLGVISLDQFKILMILWLLAGLIVTTGVFVKVKFER